MYAYNEVKIGKHSVFERVLIGDDGAVVLRSQVDIPLLQVDKDGFTYLLLYDEDMRLIESAYTYLNHLIAGSPINTRLKKATALRFLYCFLSLSNTAVDKIGEAELSEYEMFLRGIGGCADLRLQTQRTSDTINGHLSAVRDYFAKCGIECPALFRTQQARGAGLAPEQGRRDRYASSVRAVPYCDGEVPKYISPEEFGDLYSLAVTRGDKTAQVLMHLMYAFGLRIGECLGLTMEDIAETRVDGRLTPVLTLRNRLSDERFQHAKGLMHVRDPRQYATDDYRSSSWVVPISYSAYELVLDYIEESHAHAMSRYPEGYAAGAADTVTEDGPDENHYVFINRYGRPLSAQTWGNALKSYFREAGIPVDYEARRNNLSHRFRHGYAMLHVWYRDPPIGILELQKRMRHRSISSTMVYFNPTIGDQIAAKGAFQESIHDLIPELKGGIGEL